MHRQNVDAKMRNFLGHKFWCARYSSTTLVRTKK